MSKKSEEKIEDSLGLFEIKPNLRPVTVVGSGNLLRLLQGDQKICKILKAKLSNQNSKKDENIV